MKTPTLVPIDLKKCFSKENDGSFHDHKDIKSRKQYLAKVGGTFAAGTFSRQWYGWSFNAIYDAGLQLDKPGTNASMWQGLWEIVR